MPACPCTSAPLQGATIYEDGYTRDSEPVRWFWDVVHAWDQQVSLGAQPASKQAW